jgi:hypothetical protein
LPHGPINVTFVTAELGLGGTEKGLVSFATRLDRGRFAPRVVTLAGGGPREATLRDAGVPVVIGCGDEQTLARELEGSAVVHVFRHGITAPLVPAATRRAAVPILIEENVFGARDRSSDERDFACHLFLSMMCLLRYRRQGGAAANCDARHRVLYLPTEGARLREVAPAPHAARERLGLDPERAVVTRLGRAADLKWRDMLIDMLPRLFELMPDVQVVLVGATPAKRVRLARRGLLDRVRLIDPVSSEAELATLYSASDVVVNASMIGESQGLVIGEAMSMGIPVVTCSTPWVDNAQVEFVQNGRTGWVANHPLEFAEAVANLLRDAERRAEFGQRARGEIDRRLDPERLTRQLEALYEHHLNGGSLEWEPGAEEIERFARAYPRTTRDSFRLLSSRERVEAAGARFREALTRRSAAAQMLLAPIRARLGALRHR